MKNTSKSKKECSLPKNTNFTHECVDTKLDKNKYASFKNEFINKFYDNILSFTKHLSSLLIILNGTGAVTVFSVGDKMYNFSLFFFVIGVIAVVISLVVSYGFMVAFSKDVYISMDVVDDVTKFYKIYSFVNLMGFIIGVFCLFIGLSNGYNIISR